MDELYALLNFLEPDVYYSNRKFMQEYGDMKDKATIDRLQTLLKPLMLRRMKEDVEKSIAPKEETIVEVELTNIQKKYYRAIIEKNFEFLAKGGNTANMPSLMNTMMELRKCCNHPFLIKGAEDNIMKEYSQDQDPLKTLIVSCGKMVLVNKLLPKLKAGGHKVLIFSQMVRCLDIIEDFLIQSQYKYERIDGRIRGNERQMAIDRFSKKDSDRFVFLLCTRAGGLGINLTAADTVIIYDSDWNPQNDLQAQARCHRIGQSKMVKIYRLITRNSYERDMFDRASLKLGLDKAVLQSMTGRRTEDGELDPTKALTGKEVETLLKKGAYGTIMEDDTAGDKFCEEDIEQILSRRTQTIKIEGGVAGSTFSKASFATTDSKTEIDLDDPDFWNKWAEKANLDIDELTANKLIIEQPRMRKQTQRYCAGEDEFLDAIKNDSDDESNYSDDESVKGRGGRRSNRNLIHKKDFFKIEKGLLNYGWGRWNKIENTTKWSKLWKNSKGLSKYARAIFVHCLRDFSGDQQLSQFIWDLITPRKSVHAKSSEQMRNHDGLTAKPVGRKGRRGLEAVEQATGPPNWANDFKVETWLPDESFRKFLLRHSNRLLTRVRQIYYLSHEILAGVNKKIDNDDPDISEIKFDMPEYFEGEVPAPWWNKECDISLLVGTYKHGWEHYNLMRNDSKLIFSKLCPLEPQEIPKDENEEEENENDEKSEKNEETPPLTPASKTDKQLIELNCPTDENKPRWPPAADISARLRKLFTQWQRFVRLRSNQNMQAEQFNAALKALDPQILSLAAMGKLSTQQLQTIIQTGGNLSPQLPMILSQIGEEIPALVRQKLKVFSDKWARREESDFYRAVSTFGIQYKENSKDFDWQKFRQVAKLEKKTDQQITEYYLTFKYMCDKICGKPVGEKPDFNIQIETISEERASRALYRIQLLDKIRTEILRDENLDERLKLCKVSNELPPWWRPGYHDKQLLIGLNKHGLTRSEQLILQDPEFTFRQDLELAFQGVILDYDPKSFSLEDQLQWKAEQLQRQALIDNHKNKTKSSSEPASETELPSSPVLPEVRFKVPEKAVKLPPTSKSPIEIIHILQENNLVLRWPKDRILTQRAEHICFAVEHNEWPGARLMRELTLNKDMGFDKTTPRPGRPSKPSTPLTPKTMQNMFDHDFGSSSSKTSRVATPKMKDTAAEERERQAAQLIMQQDVLNVLLQLPGADQIVNLLSAGKLSAHDLVVMLQAHGIDVMTLAKGTAQQKRGILEQLTPKPVKPKPKPRNVLADLYADKGKFKI